MNMVRARWFPADVKFPGQPWPWQRVYVIAADDGLHIWQAPGETAVWHSPVDWSRTVLPIQERDARNGVDVWTEAGLVVVTLGSGCRCGALGHWAGPSWAQAETIRV